jgi:DNA-binding MarR family transcriptional regulator
MPWASVGRPAARALWTARQMSRAPDPIDALVGQWGRERSDLDLETMARVARVLEVARLIDGEISALAARAGVDLAEGDILFALRRAGAPYRLAPSAISAALLVSSGTLTSRLDRLERKGLIRRIRHPTDRRSTEVELTPGALRAVDAAVTEHVANEQQMLSVLSAGEQAQLDRVMRKLLTHLAARRDDVA